MPSKKLKSFTPSSRDHEPPITFAAKRHDSYLSSMSAAEIIEQIKRLPPDEREKVRNFARENLEDGQLPADELGELTRQMVDSNDPAEKARLKKQIIRGFYGNAPHA